MTQRRIPAVYLRGGTSKGVFFHGRDLPADPAERERVLLRVAGSPDPYGKQIDGMGAATSSTSKVVVITPSARPDCDVDYLFGQVAIDRAAIDWSGNCGNLTSAVGPFAVSEGLVAAPRDGTAIVRIWQANIGKRIVAHVPVKGGEVVEEGDFALDGVTFPSAEIRLEFLDPGGGDEGSDGGALFPTGRVVDTLEVPGVGPIEATLVTAGNPTVFVEAKALGLAGTELQGDVNGDKALLARLESVRAQAAVAMGLAASAAQATRDRPATPKLAFVSPPQSYTASDGKRVEAEGLSITARILSMGVLHHAMTGTGAVAIAVAAAIPGTIVHRVLRPGSDPARIVFGHPSGTLAVGAEAVQEGGQWKVAKAVLSRSARRLMEGWVRVPSPEIAPAGVLRVGVNFGNPVIAQRAADGTPQGVGPALARELARRLGLPVEFVAFDTAGKMADAAKAGAWDVAFLAADPARATDIDFTAPYVLIEGTYLVRADSPYRGVADLDQAGRRIAVGLKTAYDLFLTREIRHAALERVDGSPAAIERFVTQGLDAAAGVRQPLAAYAAAHHGLRVLEESFMVIRQAAAVPKGRPGAAAVLAAFIEEAKASGFVRRSLEASGQGEVTIAPPA
ncbi:MAG TPA: 2-methylaconitate cis-trans isomerase PrpF [Usitatibacteraceae bacterium]|nr:2-methylaconitate cis-trans isomerase PrpF [Usitatibacteraceae bacterium]HRA21943.1 2-methylaconitate cis-trans isomerase PrpF [Usitatibacteraceae bacterium]